MHEILVDMAGSQIIKILALLIIADVMFGVLKALKERKFISEIGINGIIRKTAIIVCIVVVFIFDCLIDLDLTMLLPDFISAVLPEIGVCEIFGVTLAVFELESIIANFKALGVPFPTAIGEKIHELSQKFEKGDK